jgi:hypothetical protein
MTRTERIMLQEFERCAEQHRITILAVRSGDQSVDRLRAEMTDRNGRRLRLDLAETDHDAAGRPARYWYGLLLPDDPRGPFYVGYHCHEEIEQPGEGDLPHRVVRIDGLRAHWRREPRRLTITAAIAALINDIDDREAYRVQPRHERQEGETFRAYRRRKIAAARAA